MVTLERRPPFALATRDEDDDARLVAEPVHHHCLDCHVGAPLASARTRIGEHVRPTILGWSARGGATTMSTYCIVADPDAHFARAKAAGAEITREPQTQDYGGRDYTCKDPEGNVWTFGTYDPWAGH